MHHPVRRVIAIVSVVVALVCLRPAPHAHAGINDWTQTGPGPSMTFGNTHVNVITINPHTPTTLYAGTDNGFFRSTDNGATWQVRGTETITHSAVTAIVVDPQTPTTLYIILQGSIYRSSTNGDDWELRSTGIPQHSYGLLDLLIDPQTPTTLYTVVSLEGVYVSNNSGSTWHVGDKRTSSTRSLASAHVSNGTSLIYAGGSDGIAASHDGGTTWTQLQGAPKAIRHLLVNPRTPTTMYAYTVSCVEFGEAEQQCTRSSWRSADSGSTWQSIPWTPLFFTQHDPPALYAFDHIDVDYTYVNTGLVWSYDDGATWQRVIQHAYGLYPAGFDIPLAASAQDPPTLYAVDVSGGFDSTSDNGATWHRSTIGDTVYPPVAAFAISPSSPLVRYAAVGAQVYTSTDGGNTLRIPAATVPFTSAVHALWADPQNADTVYASTGTNLYRSTDQAHTWTPLNQAVSALVIDPHTPNTLYAIRHAPNTPSQATELARSTDRGTTWTPALLAALPPFTTTINALALKPHTPTTVYAGTTHGVYRSGDAGTTWQPLSTSGFTSTVGVTGTFALSGTTSLTDTSGLSATLDIRAVATSPLTPTTIYVGAATSGVYRSRDAGATWQPCAVGLPLAASVSKVVINPRKPGVLYALLGDNRVYRSRDDGDTWSAVPDSGLPPINTINDLMTSQDGSDTVYVATDAGLLTRTFVPADQVSQLFVPLVSR